MASIYRREVLKLYEIVEKAGGASGGADILIPDLQRPYVWTPNQVVLLVDSLIRGWPFGTLLTWKVTDLELGTVPARTLWGIVDRTNGLHNGEGTVVPRKNPPANFLMILDGQQRVQSLLLALGNDDFGFKMDDRDWAEELDDRRPRGRTNYRHWSKGSLCLHLPNFLAEYEACGKKISAIDYRKVLQWVVMNPQDGQSVFRKRDDYKEVLEKGYPNHNPGIYVRFSRFWHIAPLHLGIMPRELFACTEQLLKDCSVSEVEIEKFKEPTAELIQTLVGLKYEDVSFLQLQAFSDFKGSMGKEEYSDAVVNIFTRLNTAGRTLTREEITMAWLKIHWEKGLENNNQDAGTCFRNILQYLREEKINVEMDDLVGAVSFIWSSCYKDGSLVSNKELLDGTTVAALAKIVAKKWNVITEAIQISCKLLKDRGLGFGRSEQYTSVYSLAVLWTLLFIAIEQRETKGWSVTQKDGFQKSCIAELLKVLDRWMICSQWAGRWGSMASINKYPKDLYLCWKGITANLAVKDSEDAFRGFTETLVSDLAAEAEKYINELAVSRREQVFQYRLALWVWHRLDANGTVRWDSSKVQLRFDSKQKTSPDVDHIVSYDFWENKIAAEYTEGPEENRQNTMAAVNWLGNCALLDKSFNISKSNRSLDSFLQEVYEFKTGGLNISAWCDSVLIGNDMNKPDAATVESVLAEIMERDKMMRKELVDFIKGIRVRADV